MKPLKLTMSAFGPYANVEVVDFTKLNGRNIFLITGPTGAGKTTIFDGISYSIYGSTNGGDRDGESLRSHFSKEDVLTYVELEFELRNKKYIIKRVPKQIRKRAKGEGTTEQKPEAELICFLSDGKKVFTGVNNVNTKIEEIMGLNCEQFRQIMMIPQGEFRQLLVCESKEREKILQKIFGTAGYKRVEYILSDMAKVIYVNIKKCEESLNENVIRINCDESQKLQNEINNENKNYDNIVDSLKELIRLDEEKQKESSDSIEKFNEILKEKQEEIIKTEDNNKKLLEKENLEKEKVNLEKRKDYILNLTHKVDMAKSARIIFGTEKNLVERTQDVKNKTEYLLSLKEKLKCIEIEFNNARERYEAESMKQENRDELLKEITLLKGFMDRAKNISLLETEYKQYEKKLREIVVNKDNIKDKIEKLKNRIDQLNSEFDESRAASIKYLDISKKVTEALNLQGLILKIHKENTELENIRKEYIPNKKIWDDNKKFLECEKDIFEDMQQKFLRGQAAILAEKLQQGMPCPVCGSLDHPMTAHKESNLPSESSLRESKNKILSLEKAETLSREKVALLEAKGISQKEVVDNLKKEIDVLIDEDICNMDKTQLKNFINIKEIQINKEISELKISALDLEKKKNLEEKLSKDIGENNNIAKQLQENLEKINEEYTSISGKLSGVIASKKQLESELPEEARSFANLVESIKSKQAYYDNLIKQYKQSEEEYKNKQIDYEKNKTYIVSAEKALSEAKCSMENVRNSFQDEILSCGFKDEKQYNDSKLDAKEIGNVDKEIKEYHENFKSVIDRYDKILFETKDIVYGDIEKIKQDYENTKISSETLIKQNTELFSKIQNNKNSLKRIEDIRKTIIGKEEQYRLVGDLSEVAKGNNSERITFERYVLAAFFDNIVNAANVRLRKMTDGRYELNRISEKGKGLTQSGLELQVFDNYTGRYRHVKTLSGGESFKASLSLALGLADVVQSYAGGISLDTMFIDEGFGTLDSESLENAIECLIELQESGRLVGIISHVPELKERIDAKLEIQPSNEGSTTRFNIV